MVYNSNQAIYNGYLCLFFKYIHQVTQTQRKRKPKQKTLRWKEENMQKNGEYFSKHIIAHKQLIKKHFIDDVT